MAVVTEFNPFLFSRQRVKVKRKAKHRLELQNGRIYIRETEAGEWHERYQLDRKRKLFEICEE